jgi:C4-dicarboxylate-specific signal transduction histidine kinase
MGALTASIAHEVNQPLAGIMTNASTCLSMLAADPPNLEGARATTQRTLRDGNRASAVIKKLRALFARKQPAMEPVDLNDAAREVLLLSASELHRGRVTLRTDLDSSLSVLSGDRVQLQQVILNLVANAVDAMREVNNRPRNLLVATSWGEANEVLLSVCDSGVGIDTEHLGKLFDAFYTTKANGMGVGLSISRSIIESHEGRTVVKYAQDAFVRALSC